MLEYMLSDNIYYKCLFRFSILWSGLFYCFIFFDNERISDNTYK